MSASNASTPGVEGSGATPTHTSSTDDEMERADGAMARVTHLQRRVPIESEGGEDADESSTTSLDPDPGGSVLDT